MSTYKPCPFCGSEDIFMELAGRNDAYCVCNSCGAIGPHPDPNGLLWNSGARHSEIISRIEDMADILSKLNMLLKQGEM